MGQAVRDFIPEGVDMTPNESANRNRQAAIRTGANHVDFIADPESGETTQKPRFTQEERADRAMDAAVARAKAASDADWDTAILRLAGWTPVQAIQAIQRMPQQVMELYLIAEESNAHRHDVLSVFPTPDPKMYRRYAPVLYAEKFGAEVDAVTEEVAREELPVEAAPEETSTPVEVFLCTDCDSEFKTVAGLKSHGRAKHGDVAADEPPQAEADVPQAGDAE